MDKRQPTRGRPKAAEPMRSISIRLPPNTVEIWRETGEGWRKRMAAKLVSLQENDEPKIKKLRYTKTTGKRGRPTKPVKLEKVTLRMPAHQAERLLRLDGWPDVARHRLDLEAWRIKYPEATTWSW